MGLFKGQFANVVEWEEYRDDIIFWKWPFRVLPVFIPYTGHPR